MSRRHSATSSATVSHLRASIVTIRQACDRALAILEGDYDGAQAAVVPTSNDEPKWGSLGEASGLLQRSPETAAKHVTEFGLGVFENGRWRVDLTRVRAHLNGRGYVRLDPHPHRPSRPSR
jgi:hypothetical protein